MICAEDLVTANEVADLVGRPKHMVDYWLRFPERFEFPSPVRKFRQFALYDIHEVREWMADHSAICPGFET